MRDGAFVEFPHAVNATLGHYARSTARFARSASAMYHATPRTYSDVDNQPNMTRYIQ